MSGYKNVTCENCHELWSVIDPEYPWFCYDCQNKMEEFRIYGPAGSSQSLSSRGDGRASLVQGCHDPRVTEPITEPSPEDQMLSDTQEQLQTARKWYSDLAKKYINQTVDLELRLHKLQNTRWARFKRWIKEEWESEVAL